MIRTILPRHATTLSWLNPHISSLNKVLFVYFVREREHETNTSAVKSEQAYLLRYAFYICLLIQRRHKFLEITNAHVFSEKGLS